MSLRPEGGAFRCGTHGFETANPVEWEKHLLKTMHRTSGSTTCVDCGTPVQYGDVVYRGAGKPIFVACQKCRDKRRRQKQKDDEGI